MAVLEMNHAEIADRRENAVKEILATTLKLARELQRELGRLQQIVDSNIAGGDADEHSG